MIYSPLLYISSRWYGQRSNGYREPVQGIITLHIYIYIYIYIDIYAFLYKLDLTINIPLSFQTNRKYWTHIVFVTYYYLYFMKSFVRMFKYVSRQFFLQRNNFYIRITKGNVFSRLLSLDYNQLRAIYL